MSSSSNGNTDPFDLAAIRQTYRAIYGSKSHNRPTTATICRVIKRQRTKFIKGPIPLPWIIAAANLPGKAVAVALVLKYLAGVQQTEIVKLEPKVTREFGINRHAVSRGLKSLEDAGLVQVSRGSGRAPTVTIMGFNPDCAPDVESEVVSDIETGTQPTG